MEQDFFFPSSTLSMSFYYLFTYMIFNKSLFKLFSLFLCRLYIFSLALFKFFSLCLVFSSLNIILFDLYFFNIYLAWFSLRFLVLWLVSVINFRNAFYVFSIYSAPFHSFFVCVCVMPIMHMIVWYCLKTLGCSGMCFSFSSFSISLWISFIDITSNSSDNSGINSDVYRV